MPDTDVLADAFASFTHQATAEITIPGSGDIRRIIRRRSTQRTVVTAFALVLVLVGGVAVWGRTWPRGATLDDSGAGALHPDSAATLAAYRDRAINALPSLSDKHPLSGDSAIITGPYYSNPPRGFLAAAEGYITIYFVCVGTGTLNVNVNVHGGSPWSSDFNCTSVGARKSGTFESTRGYLYVEITAGQDCVQHCGFAYEIVDGTAADKGQR